jgi:hypothetical protein
MHIRTRTGVFAASLLAAAALVAGGGALAGPASAAPLSSTNCAFSNGCATLNGTDAAGNAVSMDAKYQNPKEIVIGYPDKPGDGATSFDAVIHYTSAKGGYADTGLTVKDFDNTCHTSTSSDHTPAVTGNTLATGAITAGGNNLAVSTFPDGVTFTGGNTQTLNWVGAGSHTSNIVVAETYGAGCVALWAADVSVSGGDVTFTGFTLNTGNAGGHIHETNTGSSVDTFTDSVSGGTFSFTALPAGVSQSGGVLTADTSTAIPGTYTSIGVVYTEPGGVIDTASFTLVITGNKVTLTDVPYYTFVYAKNGVWSNQCVTDDNGSGGLNLQVCTLGKNQYQDWFALNSAGTPQGDLQTNVSTKYWIQNVLAAMSNKANSCLIDNSTLAPGTPESDAIDSAAGGRELRATGSCTAAGDTWGWRT